jgi:nitrite reductase/ring-hydroxylating ferredoxin subunit
MDFAMRHATQVEQIREMIGHIDNHTVPDAGRILACPMTSFTDLALAARERELLFREHPQMIGLSGDLDGPGTFLTINDVGVPILATRDKNGTFRAFLNACRHRGVQVADDPRGKASRFTCPYHAWTYGIDGRLLAVREAALFGNIDKSCNGLIELPAEERYGMLWVHPKRDGHLDVEELLGSELADELASWELGRSVYAASMTLERPLNWKLASDTFCEAYHFGVLHSETVANFVHGDFSTYKSYGRHHRMVVPNRAIKSVLAEPEENWSIVPVSVVAYYLFPNVHLISNGNILSITRIFPDARDPGVSTSRIAIYISEHLLEGVQARDELAAISGDTIYSADTSKPMALDVGALVELFETTVAQEDYFTAAKIQVTANSGMVDSIKFGRNEPGVQHAHNAIRDALGLPPLAEHVDA